MAVAIPTDFVPSDLDASRWENLEPLLDDLRDRPIDPAAECEQCLIDRI